MEERLDAISTDDKVGRVQLLQERRQRKARSRGIYGFVTETEGVFGLLHGRPERHKRRLSAFPPVQHTGLSHGCGFLAPLMCRSDDRFPSNVIAPTADLM